VKTEFFNKNKKIVYKKGKFKSLKYDYSTPVSFFNLLIDEPEERKLRMVFQFLLSPIQ